MCLKVDIKRALSCEAKVREVCNEDVGKGSKEAE